MTSIEVGFFVQTMHSDGIGKADFEAHAGEGLLSLPMN